MHTRINPIFLGSFYNAATLVIYLTSCCRFLRLAHSKLVLAREKCQREEDVSEKKKNVSEREKCQREEDVSEKKMTATKNVSEIK